MDAVAAGVTAAQWDAAAAGLDALAHGGNAVDAAVATAFALAVVDPANCGIGGHGGCMVVAPAGDGQVLQVDFNTRCPAGFDPRAIASAPKTWKFAHGAATVTVPAVCAGLLAAHRRFGRLDRKAVLAPAIALAEKGFAVTKELAASLEWAARHHEGLTAEFKRIFFAGGEPLREGATLRQPDLARTLWGISEMGEAALRDGPFTHAIASVVQAEGGSLTATDISDYVPCFGPAHECRYSDAAVFGAAVNESGFEILSRSLIELEGRDLGPNRSPTYVDYVASALRAAWTQRRDRVEGAEPAARHTTHLCAVDPEGLVVSLTFTHGPLWFGSGMVAPGTGIVLNAAANLLRKVKGSAQLVPLHNMTPVVIKDPNGAIHALGSPGGSRIPAIVLQAIVDLLRYSLPLAESLRLPRLSVDPGGAIEIEDPLRSIVPEAYVIERYEYYGPASGLTLTSDGRLLGALDPRFNPAFARLAVSPANSTEAH